MIARHGLDARKSLGQHFLLDPNVTAKIARLAGDLAGRHVLEIGPGPGGLTRALLDTPAASVVAVERDPRCIAALAELGAVHGARLRVIEADATGVGLVGLLPAPRVVVANLPYNVGTSLLIGLLREAGAWESLTLMFQREVAERIVAAPGSDAYGRLAVLTGFVARAAIVMRLPPDAFTPPPSVWSAVVRIFPLPDQPDAARLRTLERVTEAAFGQRRKMLRSALKPLGDAAALLEAAGIDPTRRAETLSIAEFGLLAAALDALR